MTVNQTYPAMFFSSTSTSLQFLNIEPFYGNA